MDFYFHVRKIYIFENFHVWVSFFHALKKGPEFQPIGRKFKTRMIFWILRTKVTISVGYLKTKVNGFFTYTPFNFHVRDIWEIFTHRFGVSRAVFKIFSRKGRDFHVELFENFHVRKKNYTGKNINTVKSVRL